MLRSSGKVRLVNYLRNVGSIRWVLAWQEYMTQRPLRLQKHRVTLQWPLQLQMI